MTVAVIRDLLEDALATILPAIDTVHENQSYDPIADTPYQKVHLLFADPQNPTFSNPIASPFTRELGIFQITLQYPSGVGTKDIHDRVDLIRSTFFQGGQFTSGAVTLTISRKPTVAPGRNDGDRWAIPIKISFFANVFE